VEKPKIFSCVLERVNFMDEVGAIVVALKAIQESLEEMNASDVEVTMVVCVVITKIKAGFYI
jgi:CHAD domain-containing protein